MRVKRAILTALAAAGLVAVGGGIGHAAAPDGTRVTGVHSDGTRVTAGARDNAVGPHNRDSAVRPDNKDWLDLNRPAGVWWAD